MMSIRNAVIMCAGNGYGLWPITETVAKPMVKLLGKSLLFRILEGMKGAGIRNAYFVTNYLEEKVMAEAKADCGRLGIAPYFIHQKGTLGTADAVRSVSGSISEPFIVASGDHVLDVGIYKDAVKAFENESIVVLKKVKNPSAYGVAEVSNGTIAEMVEKPAQPKTDLANVGIYVFNESIFNELQGIKLSVRNEYEITDALKGKKAFITEKYWLDVGMPWMLLEALDFLFSIENSRIRGEIYKTEVGEGKVIVEEGAVVEDAVVDGNLYIGKNASIGPFSSVMGGVCIGEGTSIMGNCTISRSVMGAKNAVRPGCFIGDSVIGSNAELGASVQLANQRFDRKPVSIMTRKGIRTAPGDFGSVIGDNVKMGVNSSVLPGRLIGTGAWVFPNSVVSRNVNLDEMYGFIQQR
jgi:bifunctional UDP-N-acetylglucosamine pyrophosphorylase/glucosamine-1-phosphate N-acetyltransferase